MCQSLESPAEIYGLVLIVSSIVMGLVCLYSCRTYTRYQQSGSRFFQIRNGYLTLCYSFFGAVPSLLVIAPAEVHANIQYNPHAFGSAANDESLFFYSWMSIFLHELCISVMLIILCCRCWLLIYHHYYVESVVHKKWQGLIAKNHTNFWLQHRKTWGDFGFVLLIGMVALSLISMLLSVVSISVLQDKHLAYLSIISFIIGIVCCAFMFAIIYFGTKIKKFTDSFKIMSEMKLLVSCTVILCLLYCIEIIILFVFRSSRAEILLMHETGHIVYAFVTCCIQTQWVVYQFRRTPSAKTDQLVGDEKNSSNTDLRSKQAERNLSEFQRSSSLRGARPMATSFHDIQKQIELQMMDVLANEVGFEMFMRHCQAEFNVEGLLFIMEVAWYQSQIFDVNSMYHRQHGHQDAPRLTATKSCTWTSSDESSGVGHVSHGGVLARNARISRGMEPRRTVSLRSVLDSGIMEDGLPYGIPGITTMASVSKSPSLHADSYDGHMLSENYGQIVKQLHVSFDGINDADKKYRPKMMAMENDEEMQIAGEQNENENEKKYEEAEENTVAHSQLVVPTEDEFVKIATASRDSPPVPSEIDRELDDEENEQEEEAKSLDWMYHRARHLFVKYIDVESEFSINVSHSTREELLLFFMKDRVHGFTRILDGKQVNVHITNFDERIQDARSQHVLRHQFYSMFDNAKSEIWALLSGDSFVRFMQTKEYQYLLQKHQNSDK